MSDPQPIEIEEAEVERLIAQAELELPRFRGHLILGRGGVSQCQKANRHMRPSFGAR